MIPLEQGSVFRPIKQKLYSFINIRLNPFGTGQCLSTVESACTAS